MQMPGGGRLGRAVDEGTGYRTQQPVTEPITHRCDPTHLLGSALMSNPQRSCERDHPGHVHRPGANPALLTATLDLGVERYSSSDDEHTDALRTAELVTRDRDQVPTAREDRHIHPRHGLDRVGVEDRLGGVRSHRGRDVRQRLNRADLVVDCHDRHQCRPGIELPREVSDVDEAYCRHPPLGDPEPLALEPMRGREHTLVLERRGDHAVQAASACGPGAALDRQVVGLGATRGEHDLVRSGAQHIRDGFARRFERRLRGASTAMTARRVSRMVGEKREHGLDRLGPHRSTGRVIEVRTGNHLLSLRRPGPAPSSQTLPTLRCGRRHGTYGVQDALRRGKRHQVVRARGVPNTRAARRPR